jgi:MFS family permease
MAALMVPQVMSLMQVMYKPSERAPINGLFGMLGGMAASLGPVIGGLLIKGNFFGWDWRPIFLINVPVGIFGLIMALKYLPNGKSSHPLKLDIAGTFMVMVAMLLLVFPLIQGRDLGWPMWTFVMMAASLPIFVLFGWWQRRKQATDGSPLVLPALFRNISFGVGLGINMIFEMAMIGFFLTFTLLLQVGLGFSAIHAALTGLPTAFGIALTMSMFGKVLPKLGRYALSAGTVVMAAGLTVVTLLIHHYGLSMHSWQFIPGLLVVGVGMGLVFASLFAAVLNGVDPSHAGSASGTLNAVQQVGAAIGIALIGVVFFGQLSHNAPNSFAGVEPQLKQSLQAAHIPVAEQGKIVTGVKNCFVDRSREKDSSIVPESCKQAEQVPATGKALGASITQAATKANAANFDHAFRWSWIYDLGLLGLTFILTFLLPRRFRAEAYAEV